MNKRTIIISLVILLLIFTGCSANSNKEAPNSNPPATGEAQRGVAVTDNIYYIEQYELMGDWGDGLSPDDAAKVAAEEIVMFLKEEVSADEPQYVVLVDLEFVNEQECYIFEVYDKRDNLSIQCAVGYDGAMYIFTEEDGEYHPF